jgi:hypothetical protein
MQRTKAEMSTVCYLKKRIRKNTLQLPPPVETTEAKKRLATEPEPFPILFLFLTERLDGRKKKKNLF